MNTLLIAALLIFCYMLLLWMIASIHKNNGIADVGWGTGFAVVSIFLFYLHPAPPFGLLLITGMITIWGARLSAYLFNRNLGKPEDWRYANWRKAWGKHAVFRSLFQVFLLQGGFMYLNLLPVLVANVSDSESSLCHVFYGIGFGLWLIGFLFESIADYQMLRFKANPDNKGRVMKHGLWRYSRHPNYFGEALLHWGIFVASIPFGYWFVSVIAPITITYLLLKVSGVAMLERKYEGNEEYINYQNTTSPFFPLPPKSI